MRPLVSIVLVNYNGFQDTVECLKSLREIDYDNYNIIVVDNASPIKPSDEDLDYITKNSVYIKEKHNHGFSGGNNIGIKFAETYYKPKYILILNNDTVVEKNFLDILIKYAEADPEIGIVTGKINYYYNRNLINAAGGLINIESGMVSHLKCGEIDSDSSDYCKEITFASGCLWLVPTDLFDKVGYMDESMFLYAEDSEFCCRVLRQGYKIIYCNAAKIYHKENRSTGRRSFITQYYYTRNNFYIIDQYALKKTYGKSVFLTSLLIRLLKKDFQIKPVIKGITDYKKGIKGPIIGRDSSN